MKRRHARKRRSPASIRRMRTQALMMRLACAMPFAAYLPVSITRGNVEGFDPSKLKPQCVITSFTLGKGLYADREKRMAEERRAAME